jgi:hypothetical protein
MGVQGLCLFFFNQFSDLRQPIRRKPSSLDKFLDPFSSAYRRLPLVIKGAILTGFQPIGLNIVALSL